MMSDILKKIGSNIRFYRNRLHLSQERLAELSSLHRTYIGAVERGEKNISAINIARISAALGIGPELLVKGAEYHSEEVPLSPLPVKSSGFNKDCTLPYGLETAHVRSAMEEFIRFLSFINHQLYRNDLSRLEDFLMPANFSSIVGEFMCAIIPNHCEALSKNRYHNGHPDLIPRGNFPDDAVQHTAEGIEVKSSRYSSGWQGHNPESVWLMVFHFKSSSSSRKEPVSVPFQFRGVYAAKLEESDWGFSGRSANSRRTITASVKKSGAEKMKANWVYKDSGE